MDETRLNLTRRFGTKDEARSEAETNLSAGSLWVPLVASDGGPAAADRPALLRAVAVTLVLHDGAALEALKGRVSCVAPEGIAVVLDDLPPAALLTRLLGGHGPAPHAETALAPEDVPPLPPGIGADPAPFGAPEPTAAVPGPAAVAFDTPAAPAAQGEGATSGEDVFPAAKPRVESRAEPVLPAPTPAMPASEETLPAPKGNGAAVPSLTNDADLPEARPVSTGAPPDPGDLAAMLAPPPDAPAPAPVPASSESDLPALREVAEFPAVRNAAPVSAIADAASLFGDDDGGLGLPALKSGLELPAVKEPAVPFAEPSGVPARDETSNKPAFPVRFADPAELERAWQGELAAGRVLVPVEGDPPALDTRVEVTLLLPETGALVLEGTVVHRAAGGAGVRLDLDSTTRALIESALPAAGSAEPPRASPGPAEAPDASAREPSPPRRPTPELRTATTGKSEVVVAFDSLVDFRREYETNIRRGGVMVPTPDRPPVRSRLDVVFSLLGGKREVRISGEVVLHGPTGIGVQLGEIPEGTRMEIDALLAAAAPAERRASRPPEQAPAVAAAAAASTAAMAPAVPAAPPPGIGMGAPVSGARPGFTPAGEKFEGDLVEVMREAEVEGEAGTGDALGAKASWLKVLAYVQATRSTGVLKASRKAETKTFLVFQGRILDAKGEPARDDESMLRVIRKHNLARPGVMRILEKALDKLVQGAASGMRGDEVAALQATNVWSPAEIDRARRWQVLERASEVFAWERGRFAFDPNGDRTWARPTPGVPFGHVILHGIRSYTRASGEDLARVLRSGVDRAVRIVPNSGFEPTRAGMSDKELTFWADIDGKKTLRQMLATTPIGQTQTYRLVFALCRLGVLALERGAAGESRGGGGESRADALRARLSEMKKRDLFGRLGLSWMSAAPQVQAAWDALRRDMDSEVRAGGESGAAAREVLALGEDAWRTLLDHRARRLQRLKIIEDPSRIESAADMLAERAELLRLRGDKAGARAALEMAIDLWPENPGYAQALDRMRAG